MDSVSAWLRFAVGCRERRVRLGAPFSALNVSTKTKIKTVRQGAPYKKTPPLGGVFAMRFGSPVPR